MGHPLYLPIQRETEIKEPYREFYHNDHIIFATGGIKSVKKIVLSNRDDMKVKEVDN